MSLLLEALKKAELAKQQVLRPSDTETDQGLSLEPRESIITREELPEITQAIEIAPEEMAPSAPVAEPVVTSTLDTTATENQFRPPFQSTPEPAPIQDVANEIDAPPPPGVGDVGAGREAARQLFDVKEVDYNPRRPFYITLAVLGIAAASYGGYLWWQLQPRSLVNPNAVKGGAKPAEPAQTPAPNEAAPAQPVSEQSGNAPQQAAQAPAPGAAPSAAPAAQPAAANAPTGSSAPTNFSQPGISAPESPAKAPTFVRGGQGQSAPQPVTAAPRTTPEVPQPVANAPAPRSPSRAQRQPRPPITVNPPSVQPDELLEQAYAAYQKGDLINARDNYLKVLQREPNNRDALLGLAAIDLRTGNVDTAEARYLKLLELDPRDMLAQSGLIALRGSGGDPVQTESRLKTLIASNPDATHLQFTLGNQYAVQGRWREAQDAYFKAYSSEPENPDFAFNLAIALDQLRQTKLAAEFYRRALALAAKRPAAFDPEKLKARLAEVER